MSNRVLLSVQNLCISFLSGKNENQVVHDISFKAYTNEILGIVGESGSGKSVTSLSILGLLPSKTSTIKGDIIFNDSSISDLDQKEFRRIRGNEIAMIFQEPMSCLNPSMKCGSCLSILSS